MKPHVILLLNADPDVEKALNEVASQRGHDLVTARTAAESFRILRDDAKDVKLVIIDIDPEIHGVALLTAVAGLHENVPICRRDESGGKLHEAACGASRRGRVPRKTCRSE